jgi:adenylate cyclase
VTLTVDDIRACLDSGIPASIATCAADGTPNITFISQVDYVDAWHVALSFQFFNKTRENILGQRQARVYVTNSETGAAYRLALEYLRTEGEGPLFERMKARLAGVASHTGMAGVFRLRGADLYRVHHIEAVDGIDTLPAVPRRPLLGALRMATERLAACANFERLLDQTLLCLQQGFGIAHAMLLMFDAGRERLYVVASCGYDKSGVGSEIALGDGVVGVAAAQRVPIRISYMTVEYSYSRNLRQTAQRSGLDALLNTEIPFPGLAEPRSQLAVPALAGDRLAGVLYVESDQERRFDYDDEDALVALMSQFAMAARLFQDDAADGEGEVEAAAGGAVGGLPVPVRRYAENDSIFLGEDYLIKGVAGAILWKLLRDHAASGRVEFSNRELRLDPSLRLPDVTDNLEARLALLNRRLAERCDFLRLCKVARGRFRLDVRRPLQLVEVPRQDPMA